MEPCISLMHSCLITKNIQSQVSVSLNSGGLQQQFAHSSKTLSASTQPKKLSRLLLRATASILVLLLLSLFLCCFLLLPSHTYRHTAPIQSILFPFVYQIIVDPSLGHMANVYSSLAWGFSFVLRGGPCSFSRLFHQGVPLLAHISWVKGGCYTTSFNEV